MRIPTPMPEHYQAVNSTAAQHLAVGVPAVVSPQDTIEHTHLRGPEKLVRTRIYEEIASDGKWRKKKLSAKIKKMRCQL